MQIKERHFVQFFKIDFFVNLVFILFELKYMYLYIKQNVVSFFEIEDVTYRRNIALTLC